MKINLFILLFLTSIQYSFCQNVGIGTDAPAEKLDVIGTVKMNSLKIATGGTDLDFLIKSNSSGQVGFRKGHTAQAVNFIICMEGSIPNADEYTTPPYLGEIKLIAGEVAPRGWVFCHGQYVLVSHYPQLFDLIGFKYGNLGTQAFRLPNLKDTAPVGAGDNWLLGTRSN